MRRSFILVTHKVLLRFGTVGVGISFECLFVKFDTESGFLRRDEITILPVDTVNEDTIMKAASSLNAFLKEEVRRTRR